jgi:hypothetical protein
MGSSKLYRKVLFGDVNRAGKCCLQVPEVSVQINGQLIITGLLIIKSDKKGAGLLGLDALEQMDVLFDIKERLYVKKKKVKTPQQEALPK